MIVTQSRRAEGGAVLPGGDALGRAPHLRPGVRGAVRRHARGARAARAAVRQARPCWWTSTARCTRRAARRGALDFDAPEAEFVIDAAERVRAIELRTRNEAHQLIEECMILANVAVAEELRAGAHADAVPRARHSPRSEKLERLTARPSTCSASRRRFPKTVAHARSAGDRPPRARMRPSAPSSSRWSCARCRRRSTSRPTSGTSAWRSRTTRTSPRRSAAIRTWSCIAPSRR